MQKNKDFFIDYVINVVDRVTGITSLYVSDLSRVGDFLEGHDTDCDESMLQKISEKVGFKVSVTDLVYDIADRIFEKHKTLSVIANIMENTTYPAYAGDDCRYCDSLEHKDSCPYKISKDQGEQILKENGWVNDESTHFNWERKFEI